jgi:putative thioredoxin
MDFVKDILEKSKERPILVDFWAPWCGPCQFLGPILEELEKSQDKWTLIKVNVDENQEISAKLGIRGIPDVRLFINGEEKAKFTGALPRHKIEEWLDEHIPDERIYLLEEILKSSKPAKEKVDQLKRMIREHNDFLPGQVALAKMIVWGNPEYAIELVKNIPISDKLYGVVESIKNITQLLLFTSESTLPVAYKLKEASNHLKNQNFEKGIELIIEAVILNKSFEDDLPRKSAIAFFSLLGSDHELTIKYRKRFDMALY